ncbi:DUF4199 family protein [Algoriphagus sp. AGSA1]|uniref:DUF4199 family protein n=1 Tax=Algoriphagus sp. AGSA1 TaxID=2907213 RepID=UPI001F32CED8|nr:DUF4199 family protein [Algoriphagus sp. AGSA1]
MKESRLKIKWALIFVIMSLLWMLVEKLVGLQSTYIDKHMYLTILFAIPAMIVYVLALKDKKKKDYNGQMTFKHSLGILAGIFSNH